MTRINAIKGSLDEDDAEQVKWRAAFSKCCQT
jgi:hypothetical protein